MRRLEILRAVIVLILASTAAFGDDAIRQSVVKVYCTQRRPDPFRPWMKAPAEDVSGSAVVIEGKRILTSAHIVLHASSVRVKADRSSEKLTATVEAIAPGIDLALLKLEDESFFD